MFFLENFTMDKQTQFISHKDVKKRWYIVDADSKPVGRICTEVAKVLRGKNKPSFSPNIDCGDYVIIINTEKAHFTGKKMTDKTYIRHTGYPGGQRKSTPTELMGKRFL